MDANKKSRAEYWKDWYWNHGGREKVMSKRYINEYERTRKQKRMKSIKEKAEEYDRVVERISPNQSIVDTSGRKQFEAGANYVLDAIIECLPKTHSFNPNEVIDIITSRIKELKK